MCKVKFYQRLGLGVIVLLYSCHSIDKISGNYSSSQSPYVFKLNSDSTFSYDYKFQFAYGYSHGTWRMISKNEALLNSDIKKRTLPLKVTELNINEIEDRSSLSIDINIPSNYNPYYLCSIYINDSLYGKKHCDSLSSIPVFFPVKSISFQLSADERIPSRFLDTLYTETFIPKNRSNNKFEVAITLNDSLFNYKIFNDEKLEIRNKGLRFYDFRSKQWQYLKKN